MVKPDVKRDYYADLNLPPTAEQEEIKKRFHFLAKQYHPDRNPGREVEFVAKFQAVQAAHEILSDVQQKAKYDAERAKIVATSNDTPSNFRRNGPPPAHSSYTPSFYAPTSSRRATAGTRGGVWPTQGASEVPNGPGKPPPSVGAEKYAQFAKSGANQWDKAKDDPQARADALRGFRYMRSGQGQSTYVPLPTRAAPTTPRSTTGTPPKGGTRHQRSWEQFRAEQQPGFPGMSRTASARKRAGMGTDIPGNHDTMGSWTSAYAYTQGQRSQNPNSPYVSEGNTAYSPPKPRQSTSTSPLRNTRSASGVVENPFHSSRPGLERVSTQYATTGGERTYVSTSRVSRSTSFRNSPIDHNGRDYNANDQARPHSHHAGQRHHSTSPRMKPSTDSADFSSSESEFSSDDEALNFTSRPKAQRRRQRPKTASSDLGFGHRPAMDNDPALTGQFPSTNYNKFPSTQDDHTARYEYPPPPPRSHATSQRSFAESRTAGAETNSGSNNHVGRADAENVSGFLKEGENMYDPFHSYSRMWSRKWGFANSSLKKPGHVLNGLLSWAVPSSVLPGRYVPSPKGASNLLQAAKHGKPPKSFLLDGSRTRESINYADMMPASSLHTARDGMQNALPQKTFHTASKECVNTTFSAAEWDGKFGNGEEYLRPADTKERSSPVRTSRTRARSVGRGRTISSTNQRDTGKSTEERANSVEPGRKSPGRLGSEELTHNQGYRVFHPAKFSAEEWAEKLKDQTWSIPNSELNANRLKTPKRSSKSTASKKPPAPKFETAGAVNGTEKKVDFEENIRLDDGTEAMDIDTSSGDTVPVSAPTNGRPGNNSTSALQPPRSPSNPDIRVSLKDLSNVAPLGPSGTGLGDLEDISTMLPVKPRAAPTINLDHPTSDAKPTRELQLPRPPRPVVPPHETNITQQTWERYVAELDAYLHDWRLFNKKMVEHFSMRQAQVDTGMFPHWISSIGDGPAPNAGEGIPAGYTMYMSWLDEDAKCREWWNVATERHRRCFEDLGRVREKVKLASGIGA